MYTINKYTIDKYTIDNTFIINTLWQRVSKYVCIVVMNMTSHEWVTPTVRHFGWQEHRRYSAVRRKGKTCFAIGHIRPTKGSKLLTRHINDVISDVYFGIHCLGWQNK